jgi:hypothetical protein
VLCQEAASTAGRPVTLAPFLCRRYQIDMRKAHANPFLGHLSTAGHTLAPVSQRAAIVRGRYTQTIRRTQRMIHAAEVLTMTSNWQPLPFQCRLTFSSNGELALVSALFTCMKAERERKRHVAASNWLIVGELIEKYVSSIDCTCTHRD